MSVFIDEKVSKRCKQVFSSPDVYHAVFPSYGEISSGIPCTNKQAEVSFLKTLKRNHAAHTGRPYSRALYPFTEDMFEFSTEITPYIPSVAYSHCRIAWLEPERESVYVLSLVSGERTLLVQDPCPEDVDPEEFTRAVLSESMVVGISLRYGIRSF